MSLRQKITNLRTKEVLSSNEEMDIVLGVGRPSVDTEAVKSNKHVVGRVMLALGLSIPVATALEVFRATDSSEVASASGRCPPGYFESAQDMYGDPVCTPDSATSVPTTAPSGGGGGTPTTVHKPPTGGGTGTTQPPAETVTHKLVNPDGDPLGQIETITKRGNTVISDVIDCTGLAVKDCDFNEKSVGTPDSPASFAKLLEERGIDPTTLDQGIQDIFTSISISVAPGDQLAALTSVWAFVGKGEVPALTTTTTLAPATTTTTTTTTVAPSSTSSSISATSSSVATTQPSTTFKGTTGSTGSQAGGASGGSSSHPNGGIDWLLVGEVSGASLLALLGVAYGTKKIMGERRRHTLNARIGGIAPTRPASEGRHGKGPIIGGVSQRTKFKDR